MPRERLPLTPARAVVYGLSAGVAASALMSLLARLPDIAAAPARSRDAGPPRNHGELDVATPMTPASVLAQSAGPHPEGAAGLFAAKLASGLFGRDLSRYTRLWGSVVHIAYGSLVGLIYAIAQTNVRRRPALAGTVYGLLVWSIGPATLGPAMKLMPPPAKAPPAHVAGDLAAHVSYGLVVATLFDRLIRRSPARV